MNKKQEYELLKEVAQKLGPNSYLGPAILELGPWIEQQMLSDIQPEIRSTLSELETRKTELKKEIIEMEKHLENLRQEKMSQQNDLDRLTRQLASSKTEIKNFGHRLIEAGR